MDDMQGIGSCKVKTEERETNSLGVLLSGQHSDPDCADSRSNFFKAVILATMMYLSGSSRPQWLLLSSGAHH